MKKMYRHRRIIVAAIQIIIIIRKKPITKKQSLSDVEYQRKLSYFQMARLGYQELVNAIIRPPRADY